MGNQYNVDAYCGLESPYRASSGSIFPIGNCHPLHYLFQDSLYRNSMFDDRNMTEKCKIAYIRMSSNLIVKAE